MDFAPTHIFTLDDGTEVLVAVEFRCDYVAHEADGTPWATNMGPTSVWWSCRARKISRVKSAREILGPLKLFPFRRLAINAANERTRKSGQQHRAHYAKRSDSANPTPATEWYVYNAVTGDCYGPDGAIDRTIRTKKTTPF